MTESEDTDENVDTQKSQNKEKDGGGITLDLSVKQALIGSVVLSLLVGFAGGTVFGATVAPGTQAAPGNTTGKTGTDSGSQDSGSEFVSLDGVELEGEPSMGKDSAP
ncbi:MAG: hypothetical protein ABEJ95_03150, partial [Candidatus Nanohalobium sp.]